jgi:hypothetical protein
VGRGVKRARAAGEEERKCGKGGGCGGGDDHFKLARLGGGRPVGWRHAAGKGRERGRESEGVPADRRKAHSQQRPEIGGRGRRGAAMPRGRPNRGGGRGLTGGLQLQCRVVAHADRWARAAQCRAARIQTGFKNILIEFKFAQTLANSKGTFPCSKKLK